jgi:hypothetical protein
MPDGKLEYTMEITAELGQARAAADELVRQRNAARDAGREYAAYEKQLAAVEQRMASLEGRAKSVARAADLARYEASPSQAQSLADPSRSNAPAEDAALLRKSAALRGELAVRKQLAEQARAELAAYTTLSPATQDYIAKLGQATAKTGFLTTAKQDLKKAVHLVSGAFPELGAASMFSLGRLAGFIGVGTFAIGAMKASVDNLLASLTTSDWATAGGRQERLKLAWQDASLAAASYDRALRRAAAPAETAAQYAARLETNWKAAGTALDTVLSKLEEREKKNVANVGAQRINGVQDTVAQALAEARLEEAQKRRRAAMEVEQRKQGQILRERAAGNAAIEVNDLRGQLSVFRAGRQGGDTKDTLEAKTQAIRERIAQSEADIAKKQQRLDVLDAMGPVAMALNPAARAERELLGSTVDSDRSALAKAKQELKKNLAQRPARLGEIEAADEKQKDLEARLQAATVAQAALRQSNAAAGRQDLVSAFTSEVGRSADNGARFDPKALADTASNTEKMVEYLGRIAMNPNNAFGNR